MNKGELAQAVADDLRIPRTYANLYVDKIFEVMAEALANGEDVAKIYDFGVLAPATRKAHKGYNPSHDVSIDVPERRLVTFRMGKSLRRRINETKPD